MIRRNADGQFVKVTHTHAPRSETASELNALRIRYAERDAKERLKLSKKLGYFVTPREYGKKKAYLRRRAAGTFNNRPSDYVGLDDVLF